MSKSHGSDLRCFSKAASDRVDSLTAEFRSRLRNAVRELAQHVPDTRVVGPELVDLAAAKVWAESVAELRRAAAGASGVRDGGRDAA